tara:strand:+ start:649 stop:1173 length:525 start_codon:yes stop_codon:yes gene_type:complete
LKESYIKQLIRILQDSEIDTLEISSFWGKSNIKLSKNSTIKSNPTSTSTNYIDTNIPSQKIEKNPITEKLEQPKDSIEDLNSEPIQSEPQISDNFEFITAPLVGTYYSSPKPEDPPFISKGDRVEVGQTICIIEAMKIFNDIDSEISGVVEEILIENGSPVEYGQKIISIRLDD